MLFIAMVGKPIIICDLFFWLTIILYSIVFTFNPSISKKLKIENITIKEDQIEVLNLYILNNYYTVSWIVASFVKEYFAHEEHGSNKPW